MRVLVLYAHPNEASFVSAIHDRALATLRAAGHEVDDCDLYAEGFDPVLSKAERLGYHNTATNTGPVAEHVRRLQWAEALVIVSPVWNFGFPAILKGYFDRVFLPGVSFKLVDGKVSGALHNIRSLTSIMTYGADPWRAFAVGDPPKKLVTRMLRAVIKPLAKVRHIAHHDMNRSTPVTRAAFLDKVEATLKKL